MSNITNINRFLATKLSTKNANEMELQEVRSLVTNNIFNKLIHESTDKLVKQAKEAGIELDQQIIVNTAIELLKEVDREICRQLGRQGRCPDSCYYSWRGNVRQAINLLS